MNGFKQVSLALATAGLLASGVAQAALFDRGGGLIYDDVLKITWLQDANYAQTSGYDADGRMNWTAANAWAAGLSFHDSVRNIDYSDWRLPTALNQDGSGPCLGYVTPCAGSEMGHMFYNNLGASATLSILAGTNVANLALLANLQSDVYWSGTAYASDPADRAWYFATNSGHQAAPTKSSEFYAWAVRPGDVAAPIPEPESYALLLAGLGLLGVVAKRRRRSFGAS